MSNCNAAQAAESRLFAADAMHMSCNSLSGSKVPLHLWQLAGHAKLWVRKALLYCKS